MRDNWGKPPPLFASTELAWIMMAVISILFAGVVRQEPHWITDPIKSLYAIIRDWCGPPHWQELVKQAFPKALSAVFYVAAISGSVFWADRVRHGRYERLVFDRRDVYFFTTVILAVLLTSYTSNKWRLIIPDAMFACVVAYLVISQPHITAFITNQGLTKSYLESEVIRQTIIRLFLILLPAFLIPLANYIQNILMGQLVPSEHIYSGGDPSLVYLFFVGFLGRCKFMPIVLSIFAWRGFWTILSAGIGHLFACETGQNGFFEKASAQVLADIHVTFGWMISFCAGYFIGMHLNNSAIHHNKDLGIGFLQKPAFAVIASLLACCLVIMMYLGVSQLGSTLNGRTYNIPFSVTIFMAICLWIGFVMPSKRWAFSCVMLPLFIMIVLNWVITSYFLKNGQWSFGFLSLEFLTETRAQQKTGILFGFAFMVFAGRALRRRFGAFEAEMVLERIKRNEGGE